MSSPRCFLKRQSAEGWVMSRYEPVSILMAAPRSAADFSSLRISLTPDSIRNDTMMSMFSAFLMETRICPSR